MNHPETESDAVKEQLRILADADAGRMAPARIEAALLVAFREHHAEKPAVVRVRRNWPLWAGVAAVAAALALFAIRASLEQPAAKPVAQPEMARAVDPAPAAAIEVEEPEVAEPVRPARKSVKPAPRPRTVQELATAFYPLTPGFDVANAENAPRVRVKLPRTVLASFGLPVNPERINEPVQADLVIGQDGIARAIRFVRTVRLEYSNY